MQTGLFGEISLTRILRDPTALALLIANIIAIIFALWFGWSFWEIFILYWVQSIIIGLFHFFKICFSKGFSIQGTVYSSVSPAKEVTFGPVRAAFFFLLIYGFFHFIYLIFILFFIAFGAIFSNPVGLMDWGGPLGRVSQTFSRFSDFSILLTIGVFFIAHFFSFLFHLAKESSSFKGKNSGEFFSEPFSRIIPMHLTIIIFGFIGIFTDFGANILLVLIFLGIKTLADLSSHFSKHKLVVGKIGFYKS